MFRIQSSTILCVISILSCTIYADNDDNYSYSLKRMPNSVKRYSRNNPLALSLANQKPLANSIPSLFSLLKYNGAGVSPTVDWRSTTKAQQYRNKLLTMVTKAMDDVATNRVYMKTFVLKNPIDAKVVLRVGDLVKFMESKYNRLVQLYSKLQTNKNTMAVPNVIQIYEEILRGKHEIATILEVMHKKVPDRLVYSPGTNNDDRFESSIAWSYYDDNF